MPAPLISILMPAREITAYTHEAVSSVLNQSHNNIELLVICQSNVDAFCSHLPLDGRLRILSRESPGIIGALNTGLTHCSGDYIARMDSDDRCHPDRLKQQLDFALAHPDVGLIGAQVAFYSDTQDIGNGNQAYQQWLNALTSPKAIREACFIESPMPHPTLFAHKTLWQQLNGYRDKGWPEDYDLVLRCWLKGVAMAKPANTLLHWREHPQRLTRTDKRYSREAFIQAKAWALCQSEAQLGADQGRRIWICGTGRNARYWHDALRAHGANVQGFVELEGAKSKTQKRHLPVIGYNALAQSRKEELVISAISNPTARQALLAWFNDHGMRNGQDFILGG